MPTTITIPRSRCVDEPDRNAADDSAPPRPKVTSEGMGMQADSSTVSTKMAR